jgi:hypothetical protein
MRKNEIVNDKKEKWESGMIIYQHNILGNLEGGWIRNLFTWGALNSVTINKQYVL